MEISFLFTAVMFLLVGVLQAFIPFILRKTIVFGVTVPEPFVHHPKLEALKRKYTWSMCAVLAAFAAIAVFYFSLNPITEEAFLGCSLISVFGTLIASLIFYWTGHQEVKKLKDKEGWEQQVKEVHVTDMSLRQRQQRIPWMFLVSPIIVTIGLIIYTYSNYATIPDSIPTHWGPSGEADGWTEKSRLSVIILPLIMLIMQVMFFLQSVMMTRSGMKLSATATEQSAARQLGMRKYTSWFLLAVSYAITILFSFLQFSTVNNGELDNKVFLALFLSFLVVVLGGTILYTVMVTKLKEQFPERGESRETAVNEDSYWKAGLFYVNPDDPSVFVEKRFGIGWTVNFGNKWGYIIVLLPIVGIILLVFLA